MVMLDPPELVRVSARLWLLPTCTFPKLRLGALAVNAATATAVPDSGIVNVELEASLMMERLKSSVPADCGANTTLNGAV